MSSCMHPENWKCAILTPLFKKEGSRTSVKNYRPISILPRLSLIFKRILFNYMYSFVKQKLSDCQHGFRTRRSTITRLIAYIDKIYMDFDNGNTSIVVYFDFQKGFDKVPHHLLINKLRNFGFDEDYFFVQKLPTGNISGS